MIKNFKCEILLVNRTKQLTKQHIDLIGRIKTLKFQTDKESTKKQLRTSHKNYNEEDTTSNKIASSFKSTSMINTNFLILKPKPTCIDTDQIPSFLRQRTMPMIKTNKSIFSSSPLKSSFENLDLVNNHEKDQANNSLNNFGKLTNERLSMCCPVLMHARLAFNKFENDCKCRKHLIPFINDLEYDKLLTILPSDQLAVIVIVGQR